MPRRIDLHVRHPLALERRRSLRVRLTWPELSWEMFDVDGEGNVKGEEYVLGGRWEWEFEPVR